MHAHCRNVLFIAVVTHVNILDCTRDCFWNKLLERVVGTSCWDKLLKQVVETSC